ncbi:MAG: DinB family protein [Planctomycetota bacterium]|jgi:uncharacterized damage-inducible protein DinB
MDTAALSRQFGFSAGTVMGNTEGLTHEESLLTPERGGNCLNWVLGHIVATRSRMFPLLGLAPFWDEAKIRPYDRGAPPLPADEAVALPKLRETLAKSQEHLQGRLGALSGDDLAAALAATEEILGGTLGSALTAFAWHEAYHAGQVGILRRVAGKPGVLT